MSLAVHGYRHSEALVASFVPPAGFTPLPVHQISPMLNTFATLVRPQQVEVLRSAHHYLSQVEGVEPSMLASVQRLGTHLETQEEPPPMMGLTVSTLVLAWERNKGSIPGVSETPRVPALEEPAASPSTFHRISTPRPPASSESVSLGASVLTRLSPLPPPPEKAASDRPLMQEASSDEAVQTASTGQFPALWDRLGRLTSLSLKSLAYEKYAKGGSVSEISEKEDVHALLLADGLNAWLSELRESVTSPSSKKNSERVVKEMIDQIRDLVDVLWEERKQNAPVAVAFWDAVGTRTDIRTSLNHIQRRQAIAQTGEELAASVDHLIFRIDSRIFEHHLGPVASLLPSSGTVNLEEDGKFETDLKEEKGRILAERFSKRLNDLPMTDRRELTAADHFPLSRIEGILGMLYPELTAEGDSALVRSFLRNLQFDELARLPLIVQFILRAKDL